MLVVSLAGVTFFSLIIYILWGLWRSFKRRFDLIEKLPGPTRFSPLLGNIPLEIVKHIGSNFEDSKDLYYNLMQAVHGYTFVYEKERIYRLWLGLEPWIILWKAESVEAILSNNFLLEKSTQYNFLHPWLGTGLLTSGGKKWRTRRKMLVPAFHFKILHDFVPVFNEQASLLVQKLRKMEGQVLDVVPVVTACALDIICETIMGVKIGAQGNHNNDYCKAVSEVGECWLERLIQPSYWMDSLYYRSSSGKRFKEKLGQLHSFTRNVIRDRKKQVLSMSDSSGIEGSERRKAFLDLLIDHHLNGGDLTEEDIREEVDTFMFEGHDTTSMALSWIIFLLGHHPTIQEKLWSEIDGMFDELEEDKEGDQNDHPSLPSIPLNKLKDLKYLECVVKEGLRLCPSVPFIGRKLHEDMPIQAGDVHYILPSGSIVYVFIYMLHRDAQVFTRPEVFDPDRFLPENTSGRNPFVFVPFSAGPRNCIGQRFALSELKIVLSFLIRHFRFESVDHRDKILANMEMVLRPKVPLNVIFHSRLPDATSACNQQTNSIYSDGNTIYDLKS